MTDALIIPVDSSQVEKGKRSLADLAKQAGKTETAISDLGKTGGNASGAFNSISKGASSAIGSLGLLSASTIAVGVAFKSISTIDVYTKYNAQLKLATRSQLEFLKATEDVSSIARVAQADISAIGTLYARINNAVRDLGASQKDTATITENVSLALKVSGATAQESASAVLQLSQAFGSGVLRGEEFNAVNEAAPALMRALAESIGVPIGKLRELATNGQLTSDVLLKAFGDDKLLSKFREQAKEVQTISGAFSQFTNQLTLTIGKINEATGASKILIGVLQKGGTLLSVFEGGEKGSILRNYLDSVPSQKDFKNDTNDSLRILARGGRFGGAVSQQAAAELKRRLKEQANPKISGLNPDGSIAPNFNSTVVPQDVNKLNDAKAKQQQARNALAKDRADEAKKRTDALKEELQREIDEEAETADTINEYKSEKDAKLRKERIAFLKSQREFEIQQFDIQYTDRADKIAAEYKLIFAKEKERKQEIDRTTQAINNTFRESFANLINGGKGSWKSFTQSLFTTFKTTVADQIYKLFAQPFVVKIVASLLGLVGGSSASAGGLVSSGSSGGFGGLSDIGNVISKGLDGANIAFEQSIQGFGTFVTKFGSIGETIGGAISQYSGALSSVLPYAGAAFSLLKGDFKGAALQGAGVAIGSALGGPIGGAIGGALSGALGGLFGGKVSRPKFYNNSTVSSEGVKSFNSFGNSDASGKNVAKQAGGSIGAQINALADAFGAKFESFILGTTFSQKYNTFGISIGKKIAKDGTNRDVAFNPKDAGSQEKAIAQSFLIAVQRGFSDLPQYLVDILNRSSLKKADALNNLGVLGQIKQLQESLAGLPPVFDAISFSISQVNLATAGGLKGQFDAVAKYVELFYSVDEQFQTFTKQLTAQTAALGFALPASREAYRSLVDNLKVSDSSSSALFNGLVSLAPAFDTYFKQLQDQADGISEVNRALAEGLNKDLFSTYADYISAQANVAIGNSAAPFMANSPQGDSALAQEVKELRAQGANQQTVLETIAAYLYNMEKIYKQWNGDGLPETRVI